MLGDDDGLMPGYVRRVRELVERYREPEVIYQGAWLYAYPGVDPAEASGYLQPYGYAEFMRGAAEPFVLDHATRRRMVEAAMGFRVRYGFNMQFSTVSRDADRAPGAAGAVLPVGLPGLLRDQRRLPHRARGRRRAAPARGHRRDAEVVRLLPHERPRGGRQGVPRRRRRHEAAATMPGSNINTGWLSALEAIAARYPALVPAPPARRRFRFLQALSVYEAHFLERHGDREPAGRDGGAPAPVGAGARARRRCGAPR